MSDPLLITCEPLREVLSLLGPLPPRVVVLDRNLHRSPDLLRGRLQEVIDENHGAGPIILAMGMCGEATVGLRAEGATLVLPRVDDCLALLLGSQEAYREQARECPGTYYLSKGWLDSGDAVVSDYDRCVERYGAERAGRLFGALLRHYRQVVYIHLGLPDEQTQLERATGFAERFGLSLRVVPGDLSLMRDVVQSRDRRNIIRVPPGQPTSVAHFLHCARGAAG